jgi:guanylate kinase
MASPSHKLIIIAAPSGSGKTSVTKHLLATMPGKLAFSISCATRQPRNKEIHGVDYYFMPVEEFKTRIANNEFVEWEMVYEGKYYGTLKSELQRMWDNEQTPLLDVDVKGGINIQQQYPNQSLSIFIEPPSIQELEKRLRARGTETAESLKARIDKAAYELAFKPQFDKVVVNDSLERACKEVVEIVTEFLHK